MKLLKFTSYLKRRFKAFSPKDIIFYGFAFLFLGLFINSFWPRTFELYKWAWFILFIVTAIKPVLILLKKETLIEKIKFK